MNLLDIAIGFAGGLGTGLAAWFVWNRFLRSREALEPSPVSSSSAEPKDGTGTQPSTAEVSVTHPEGATQVPPASGASPDTELREWTPNITPIARPAPMAPEQEVVTPFDRSGLRGQEISRRVILHLIEQGPLYDMDVAPIAFTQEGMSAALGVRQGSLAKVLLRLVASGALTVDRRHVTKRSLRLKVYRLTPLGVAVARELQRK